MRLLNFIGEMIWVAWHPSYWLQNHPYDKDWDRELNHLLDIGEFKNIGLFTAQLCGVRIWIANQPYATMCKGRISPGGAYEPIKHRPGRRTIRRAIKALESAVPPKSKQAIFESYRSRFWRE